MKNLTLTLILVIITQIVHSQSTLDIRFNSLDSGRVVLLNRLTNKTDTLLISNHHLLYKDVVKVPTLFHLIVESYNDTRPINLVLSNEKTEIEFSQFTKSIETDNIKEIYPNQPIFRTDPNNNQVFYQFFARWTNFYQRIQELSSDDSQELLEKRKEAYHSFLTLCETIINDNKSQYYITSIKS